MIYHKIRIKRKFDIKEFFVGNILTAILIEWENNKLYKGLNFYVDNIKFSIIYVRYCYFLLLHLQISPYYHAGLLH